MHAAGCTPQPGERSPISILKTVLENENIKLAGAEPLRCPRHSRRRCKTIIILGPQYDFSDREMQLLRNFWEKRGRILLLLDPDAKTPKLYRLPRIELGVKVNDDRLMANMQDRHPGSGSGARCRQAKFLGDSPITKRLADVRAPFSSAATSSLALARRNSCAPTNIQLQPLVEAEKGYWGESGLQFGRPDKLLSSSPPGGDHDAHAQLRGVSIEKGGSGDERVQANSSRMVVVTNATFVQDNALTQDQQGLDFVSGSVELAAQPRTAHRDRAEDSQDAHLQPG